jgi:hypothetical protein
MRFAALAFWSVASSLIAVAAGAVTLTAAYLCYTLTWQRTIVEDIPGGHTPGQLSGWEAVGFEAGFYLLLAAAAAGTVGLALWFARRHGSTWGTVATTLCLIALVAWPLLALASVFNCLFVESFPLPVRNCGG